MKNSRNKKLLDEWLEVAQKYKAKRVYFKCLNNNKLSLAKKIKSKYNLSNEVALTEDRIIASGLAILSYILYKE